MNKNRIFTLMLMAAMTLSLSACNNDKENTDVSSTTTTSSESIHEQVTTPPDSYVDNSVTENPLDYTDSDLYDSIGGIENIAYRDEQVFINNEGFQYRFATNLLVTDSENGNNAADITLLKNDIEKIVIGDKEYSYDQLIRNKTDGIEVVKMFSEDFGLNICEGDGTLKERKGNITDIDTLRNSYSDRVAYDDYTVCSYYFDVKLNNLDDETYTKYRNACAEKFGTDTTKYLDGTLAVMLYYDTSGHDYFYAISLSAPTYWDSEANFLANMQNNVRKDISKCYIDFKDNPNVGFINDTVIMCSGDLNTDTTTESETNS